MYCCFRFSLLFHLCVLTILYRAIFNSLLTFFLFHFCAFFSCGRSEVVYKVKKVSSVTFQQTHCLTLDVNSPGHSATGGRSIELTTCLANYFVEEVQ